MEYRKLGKSDLKLTHQEIAAIRKLAEEPGGPV